MTSTPRIAGSVVVAALVTLGCQAERASDPSATNALRAETAEEAPSTGSISAALGEENPSVPSTAAGAPTAATADQGPGEDSHPVDESPSLTPKQERLLESTTNAEPGDCDGGSPDPPDVDGGQVAIEIARVVEGCLLVEGQVVDAEEVERTLEALREEPDVVGADMVTVALYDNVTAQTPTVDPDEPRQWWLTDLRVTQLDALAAMETVQVAVLDNGIDDRHPDLAGRVTARAPWGTRPGPGADSHGTHIAGIIAARAGNGVGGRGIATRVGLIDVPDGRSTAERIRWAVDEGGVDVINMSFCEGTAGSERCNGRPNEATIPAVAYARLRGVILVASAGNCGRSAFAVNEQCSGENAATFPAGYGGVITVGSYGSEGVINGFSTANSDVDVSAPGEQIVSTIVGGGVGEDSGTSMAAPMVAGSAAMLLGHRPDVDPDRIMVGLHQLVRDAGPPGWDPYYGYGKLDPLTVARDLDQSVPPATTTTTQPATTTAPPPTTRPPSTTPGTDQCSADISADLGTTVQVLEGLCQDGWAYIDSCPGCGGDTQQVARLVDGTWSVVLTFPIPPDKPRCRTDWEQQGMPTAILDRINWPCADATPTTAPSTGAGSPATAEAAVARLQEFIRAFGLGDAATVCEIGAEAYEAQGMPPGQCEELILPGTYGPSEEMSSIANATVDPSQATEVAPGRVEIPVGAITYPTPISDPGQPDEVFVMAHDGNDWYVVEVPTD